MKKLFKTLLSRNMDELEMHIALKSKSYAQLFTMSALFIWVIYDIIRAAMSYDYNRTIIPWLIILGAWCVEDYFKHSLTQKYTEDDEEYATEQKAAIPGKIAINSITVILTVIIAVLISVLLRHTIF